MNVISTTCVLQNAVVCWVTATSSKWYSSPVPAGPLHPARVLGERDSQHPIGRTFMNDRKCLWLDRVPFCWVVMSSMEHKFRIAPISTSSKGHTLFLPLR